MSEKRNKEETVGGKNRTPRTRRPSQTNASKMPQGSPKESPAPLLAE